MALVIDANMMRFADRMNITSSRMVRDYGLATIEEIIEAEAERGNTQAVNCAREYYHSPEKLIKIFNLTDVENKFRLIKNMDSSTRNKLLPMLNHEDLVMGLYFFTQEKLLDMLMQVNIEELVNVVRDAFPLERIIMMFTEEDLMEFFMHDDLEKNVVMEQIKNLPPEILQKFIEGVTGRPMEETNSNDFIKNIEALPDDKFKKFMASIDPDVQRQLTFQLAKEDPKHLTFFKHESYVNMLSTLLKPEMVKPMIMLNKDSLVRMISELPEDLMSIVASQVDTMRFATLLQDGHMDILEKAWML